MKDLEKTFGKILEGDKPHSSNLFKTVIQSGLIRQDALEVIKEANKKLLFIQEKEKRMVREILERIVNNKDELGVKEITNPYEFIKEKVEEWDTYGGAFIAKQKENLWIAAGTFTVKEIEKPEGKMNIGVIIPRKNRHTREGGKGINFYENGKSQKVLYEVPNEIQNLLYEMRYESTFPTEELTKFQISKVLPKDLNLSSLTPNFVKRFLDSQL